MGDILGSGLTPVERKDGQEAIPGRGQVPCKVKVRRQVGLCSFPAPEAGRCARTQRHRMRPAGGKGPHTLGGGDSRGPSLDQKMLAPCVSSLTHGPFLHPPAGLPVCLGAVTSTTAATRRLSRLAADPRLSATPGSVSIRASCAVSPQQGLHLPPPAAPGIILAAGTHLLSQPCRDPPPRGLSTLSDL